MAKTFAKKDRKLGVAQENARYDLPLQNSAGSGFLMLLVALMSFLAMMALAGGFTMSDITERWSSGLENKATVEIPARTKDGAIRDPADVDALVKKIMTTLTSHYNVRSANALSREEIRDLVSPWLGEDASNESLPLPGLISVDLKSMTPRNVEALGSALKTVSGDIHLDTHESWLNDILKLTSTLQITALVITALIGATTVTAIAGAIQSRMAEFRADIELLHLMGASDNYISRQFQRHSARLALKGGAIGVALGMVAICGFMFLSKSADSELVPSITMGASELISFILLPFATMSIAYITARLTVLRTLSHLPL
ncbi:MAG: permease [Micavibrio sp.]|nr:permease [Micavibrio sp.]